MVRRKDPDGGAAARHAGQPGVDMPFCLCWTNENWTRAWDAAEHQVLIAQKYRPEDDLGFIRSPEPFLRDPRYIRVDGAPLPMTHGGASWAGTGRPKPSP